jgi:hypothetical protein
LCLAKLTIITIKGISNTSTTNPKDPDDDESEPMEQRPRNPVFDEDFVLLFDDSFKTPSIALRSIPSVSTPMPLADAAAVMAD